MDDLVTRLRYTAEHGLFTAVDEGMYASPQECLDALETQAAELATLRAELATLRHWSWGHIDALLLYAAGSYPNDSHVKDAVAFCRLIDPKRKLRMDPIEGSGLHPASAALKGPAQ